MMGLGALLTAMAFRGGLIPAMVSVSGAGFKYAVVIIIVASTVMANCLNLYSGGMSSLTWDFPLPRWVTVAIIGVLSIVLALAFGGNQLHIIMTRYFTLWPISLLHGMRSFSCISSTSSEAGARSMSMSRISTPNMECLRGSRARSFPSLLASVRLCTVHGNDSLHRSDWEYACRHRLELFCELHSDWCGVFLLGAPTSLT